MQINLEASHAPVLASATVVMVRDAAAGLEVFLLRRHRLSDVLGGAYVFPGGKLDPEDGDAQWHGRLDRTPDQLHAFLGEPALGAPEAAALYVAAIREAFEECGVLFAEGVDAPTARRALAALRRGEPFADVIASIHRVLAASTLVPWSRWVTPAVGGVIRKRFDTRFFIATLPIGQEPGHDEREATHSAWLTPREALRLFWEREIELAPPQIMSLVHLAGHRRAGDAIDAARRRAPPLIHPEPFLDDDGVRVICYPGDERHSIAQRAIPGPTRLRHVAGRFEPEGGFEALVRD